MFVYFFLIRHISTSGYVNKPNCHKWGDENPCDLWETFTFQKCDCLVRVVVRRHHWAYFLDNNESRTVTVNSEHYRCMIIAYFWHIIKYINVEDVRFQQDSIAWHTLGAMFNALHVKSPSRNISVVIFCKLMPRIVYADKP